MKIIDEASSVTPEMVDAILGRSRPLKAEELRSRLHVIPEKGNRKERRVKAARRRK